MAIIVFCNLQIRPPEMIGLAQNAVKLSFFPVPHILVRACFSTSFALDVFHRFVAAAAGAFTKLFWRRGG
jgi:hypothetical protein